MKEASGDVSRVIRCADSVISVASAISVTVLLTMTGIVCYEVLSRSLFNAPTTWATEVGTYLFVVVVFLGLAVAQRSQSHVQVEILIGNLSAERRSWLELISHWVGLLFVSISGWQMIRFNFLEYIYDTRDWGLLATPQWIPELSVSLGYFLFLVAILRDIFILRAPQSTLAKWTLPLTLAVVSGTLFFIGSKDLWLLHKTLDAGTLVIFIGLIVGMVAWSGCWVSVSVVAIFGLFTCLFLLAQNFSMVGIGVLLAGGLLFLLIIGVRVALAMGVVGMFALYFLMPQPQLAMLADRSWTSVNTFTLTAVPAFVLMGSLLVRSGVTSELFDTLVCWFGRTPAGLAHATIGASGIFAAVSGSSLATAATLGAVTAPEMIKRNYSAKLSYGVVAAGATLGILIPPSIAMIIYGNVVGAPITVLFIAGIVPGLLLTGLFMITAFGWSIIEPEAVPSGHSFTFGQKARALVNLLPFLLLIAAVLGSLYVGIATPTEAGALGAAAALLLCLQRRQLSWKTIYESALQTVEITAFLMILVVGASIFSWVFDFLRLPSAAVEAVLSANVAPWLVMLLIALIYLALGTIIESISMMLMTLSVTFPIIVSLGFDPIWFGVVLVILIEIGLITPPVGLVLYILSGMSENVPFRDIFLGTIPFIMVMLFFVVLLYFFPGIVTWLPNHMN